MGWAAARAAVASAGALEVVREAVVREAVARVAADLPVPRSAT